MDGADGPRSGICERGNVSGGRICRDVGHSDIPFGLSVEKIHTFCSSLCVPVNHHTILVYDHPSLDPDYAHVVRDHPTRRPRDAAVHRHYVDSHSPDPPAVSWNRQRLRLRRATASVSAVTRIETHLPCLPVSKVFMNSGVELCKGSKPELIQLDALV
jgi:hypothetical protein